MNKRIALFIFSLAVPVRLVTSWPALRAPELASGNDAIGYHELAAALWQGRFPSLFRTPGYPLFLALTGATSSEHVVFALLMQVLLDSCTAVLLSLLAQRLWQSEAAAWLTGLLYAFCPVAATNAGIIGTEPLAVFLVVAALWMLYQRTSWKSVPVQSALWFAATMTRPSYALLAVIASGFAWLQERSLSLLQRQVAMLCVYAALTGSWLWFNYARAGMMVLSSNPDVSFYIYDTAALRMAERLSLSNYIRMALLHPSAFDRELELHQQSYACEEQISVHSSAPDLWFTKDDPTLIRALRAEAIKKMEGHYPLLFVIHLTGVLQGLRPRWNSAGWFFRVLDGLRILLLPLMLGVLLWQRQWWWLAFFLVWSVYALLPPGPAGTWRFRALLEPFVSLMLAGASVLTAQGSWHGLTRLLLHQEPHQGESQQIEAVSQ
jgi:hypothetical protein